MSEHVPPVRLRLLRAAYLLTFAFVGLQVWPDIIVGPRDWEPLAGVAVSFYAALSALCLLGLRNPLGMLPLLLLQLLYKAVWLVAVWLPLQSAGSAEETSLGGMDLSIASAVFLVVVVLDLVVIPWRYAMTRFVRAQGQEWAEPSRSAEQSRARPSSVPRVSGSS